MATELDLSLVDEITDTYRSHDDAPTDSRQPGLNLASCK